MSEQGADNEARNSASYRMQLRPVVRAAGVCLASSDERERREREREREAGMEGEGGRELIVRDYAIARQHGADDGVLSRAEQAASGATTRQDSATVRGTSITRGL